MKKNVIAIVAAVALVLLAVPTIAFANGMQQTWCPADGSGSLAQDAMRAADNTDAAAAVGTAIAGVRAGYVDADNNGICDNYAEGNNACPGYVDADDDGACDNYAANQDVRPGYVDADNDGVCDNYGSGACGDGNGAGNGAGNGNGNGYGNGNGNGYGYGYGYGNGNGGGQRGCMRR